MDIPYHDDPPEETTLEASHLDNDQGLAQRAEERYEDVGRQELRDAFGREKKIFSTEEFLDLLPPPYTEEEVEEMLNYASRNDDKVWPSQEDEWRYEGRPSRAGRRMVMQLAIDRKQGE